MLNNFEACRERTYFVVVDETEQFQEREMTGDDIEAAGYAARLAITDAGENLVVPVVKPVKDGDRTFVRA